MALFTQTVTKRNRSTDTGAASTYLFNNKKIHDFKEEPDGTVTFMHERRADRRVHWDEYQCSLTSEQFHAKVREEDNERWIYLQIMEEWRNNTWQNREEMWHVDTDALVIGYDESYTHIGTSDTVSGSRLYIDRGPFKEIQIRTSHTIEEIDAAGSESTSISAS